MIFSSLVFLTSRVAGDVACAPVWAQCGGINHSGATECCGNNHCNEQSAWYSQCVPSEDQESDSESQEVASSSSESDSAESAEPVSLGAVTPSLFSSSSSGKGTYYGNGAPPNGNVVSSGIASGHCSFSHVYDSETQEFRLEAFNVNTFVAVGVNNLYDGSLACGMCIEYTSDHFGSGTAMVVDSCSSCASGDLDFALDGDGRYDVEWKAIECPVKDQMWEYAFVGSSDWYIKMQIRNHKVPVARVELEHDGEFKEMMLGPDGHFIAGVDFTPELLPPYETPLKLRITSIFDEVVEDEINVTPEQIPQLSYSTPITSTKQFEQSTPESDLTRRLAGL